MSSAEGDVKAPAGTEAQVTLDLITLLQKKIIHQSQTCLNFFGKLQQRAPPEMAILDSYVHPRQDDPEWPEITAMPKVLSAQMLEIQELIEQLPELKDDDEIMQQIVSLLERNKDLDSQLKEKLGSAEETLYHGNLVTAALSRHELRSKSHSRVRQTPAEPAASLRQ